MSGLAISMMVFILTSLVLGFLFFLYRQYQCQKQTKKMKDGNQ